MTEKATLTFSIMDGPFEQARTVTVFRMLDVAVRRGYQVNVFAYEGAVGLPFAAQAKHPNAVHGRDVEAEDHPLPREWVAGLMRVAKANGGSLRWVNCGLCVDERGLTEAIDGCERGTPADLWSCAQESDNTLIVGTR
jgi:sulfur relay (sulfurtransferase) complex TusBCD TusD component (DsrE family)